MKLLNLNESEMKALDKALSFFYDNGWIDDETQLDKLKDKFIDRFISDMDVNQLKQHIRDDMNTYLANSNQEEVIGEMYGHLCDDELVDTLVTEAINGN